MQSWLADGTQQLKDGSGYFREYAENDTFISEGQYENGYPVGLHRLYDEADGRLLIKETYSDAGVLKEGVSYTEDGRSVPYRHMKTPPAFPEGEAAFSALVTEELNASIKKRKRKKSHRALVTFVVTATGKLTAANVITAYTGVTPERITPVITWLQTKASTWIPATERGLPTASDTISVTVTLYE